jgi:hypothetical protein|tara:strand:- start:66 stop:317 length:252 start_codon:yes stop_codon:yes gene_type:complete
MKYEFYIYTKEGDDVWHWDLKQTDKVIQDVNDNKNDDTFSVELLIWVSENSCDFIQIYPMDHSAELPAYVQGQVNKVLQEVRS